MQHINKEIIEQFDFFLELLKEKKFVDSNPIYLKPKQTHTYWVVGSSNVSHVTVEDEILLSVEKSKRDRKYGIKLKCQALSPVPFFRFDSDGPAHRNEDPDKPINEQKVETPHFHTFNQSGQYYAHRTPQLLDAKESSAIENDVNFGLAHFCHVTNMSMKDNTYPEVKEMSLELSFEDMPTIDFNGVRFE